ncbi:NAC domain-containing protein 90-like [Cucurbita pepo subsp. pepo]|uniref:NAC domain-containing protein 90-like n=1 Tax=Cucurbita pepo subsp. pepo TaxID=3664 RepID=UPI000C9D9FBD|nr:NAC domain-containing protein 90-like [Cucurbita pepo subsp. pepo]
MENYLIPGFRFYPTEEELVSFYLNTKLEDGRHDLKQEMDQIIPILDIYDFNPWDLPRYAGEVCKRDKEQWFFFIARQESEARGGRPKRLTTTGYWKATGSPSHVYSSTHKTIGLKKTMVFYNGRAPHGTKTEWKMNEYKAIHPSSSSSATPVFRLRQEFSLCRIYRKSKTLRSFDRRPQPRELEIAQSTAKAQAATTELPSSANEPNPTLKAPLTGTMLGESSRTIAETSNELNVEAMRDAYEPMWDWELLNWF